MILVFRFLTGLGLGAEWGPGTALVAELWPPELRGRAAGILNTAFGCRLPARLGPVVSRRAAGPGFAGA